MIIKFYTRNWNKENCYDKISRKILEDSMKNIMIYDSLGI